MKSTWLLDIKGNPVKLKKGRKGRRNRLKGARGRGTAAKEKPPIFGMIQRGGEVAIQMLEHVKKKTIESIIKATIKVGTLIFTDEYTIYNGLTAMGYGHKQVCHSAVNTLEMKAVTDFIRYR